MPHDAPGGEPPQGPGGGQPRGRPEYNVYGGRRPDPPAQQPSRADQPQRPAGRPEYNVYRSGRSLRERLRPGGGDRGGPLDPLRRRRREQPPLAPATGRPLWRRVLKWSLIAIVSWLLLSYVVFLVSAQTAPGVSDRAKNALTSGGTLLTGSNVLVLGSDQRAPGTKEPGATTAGPSRSDSIMVLHVGVGSVRKLSILRDSLAEIPGHGSGKINAAYALGGAPLAIKTVERFLGNGLKINHLILVSFNNFPKLIDALGGVDVHLAHCVRSNSFGGKRVKLKKGDHHLTGKEALRFARVRENRCQPNETDVARAARQQQVLAAMRSKLVSPLNWPSSFVRAPFIAWQAPRALRTDLHGPGLTMLFTDLLTGGSGATDVLKPDGGVDPATNNLLVTHAARARAVRKLEGG